jgi:hypothetical protein
MRALTGHGGRGILCTMSMGFMNNAGRALAIALNVSVAVAVLLAIAGVSVGL